MFKISFSLSCSGFKAILFDINFQSRFLRRCRFWSYLPFHFLSPKIRWIYLEFQSAGTLGKQAMKATIYFHAHNEISNYCKLNWAQNFEAKAICSSHVLRFYLFSQKLAHFSHARFAIKKFFYYFSSNSTRCSICNFLCQICFLMTHNLKFFAVVATVRGSSSMMSMNLCPT